MSNILSRPKCYHNRYKDHLKHYYCWTRNLEFVPLRIEVCYLFTCSLGKIWRLQKITFWRYTSLFCRNCGRLLSTIFSGVRRSNWSVAAVYQLTVWGCYCHRMWAGHSERICGPDNNNRLSPHVFCETAKCDKYHTRATTKLFWWNSIS